MWSILNLSNNNCIFCKICAGKAPSDTLYSDEDVTVFKDIRPAAQFHYLAVPKVHIKNVENLTSDHVRLGMMRNTLLKINLNYTHN